VSQSTHLGGGTVFDKIKMIARGEAPLPERQRRAEDEFLRFKAEWEQAVNTPGSHLSLGKDQVQHLRELLAKAVANPDVSGQETSVFRHVLDVIDEEA
jgi:hypothetical protein